LDIGPVEMIVLEFPGSRADPDVVKAIGDLVSLGHVTLLDLVWVTHDGDGGLVVVDFDEDLIDAGLEMLAVGGQGLLSEDDLEIVRTELPADRSAAVIVYEQTWARNIATAVRRAGGEVELLLQLPHDAIVGASSATMQSM
jgi:hypothetical protein